MVERRGVVGRSRRRCLGRHRTWRTGAMRIAAGGDGEEPCGVKFRTVTGLKMTMMTSACAGVGAGLGSCPWRQLVDLALRRTAIVGDGREPFDELDSLTTADTADDVGDVVVAAADAGVVTVAM